MATTFTKLKLSGSTDGTGIIVVATATAGTLIHTAHATALDEIWLWCQNFGGAAAVKLTVEYGAVTSGSHIEVTVPGEAGMLLVVPGLLLTNSLVVRAFAASASQMSIYGYVNRIA